MTIIGEEMKLLPCPFCGGKAYLAQGNTDAWVNCSTPGCGCELMHDSPEQVIAAWNTRSPEAVTVWQPIETAPRDCWILVAEAPYEPGPYDAYAAHWHSDGYWMARCGQYVTESPEPTHWQPLPEPPVAALLKVTR